MNLRTWHEKTIALFALAMSFKLLISITFPLGVDEAYAVAAARGFSLSFYDHPPLGFWAPVASAAVFGENLFAYRLPFLLCGAGTGWLLYLTARHLGGEKAGFFTLLLFAIAPHMALGSGAFVLPDGPLNLGGAMAAYALVRMADQPRPPVSLWIFGGVGLAIALGSKYQAGLVPFGVISFMLLSQDRWRWMTQPGFWLATVIALIGVAPVILWNVAHDWISFAFHGGRTARSLQLGNFAVMLAGQLAYLLPATFVVALIVAVRALKGAMGARVLAHLALWPIVVFNGIYLFSDASFPHWTMPGFVFALPLVGVWAAEGIPRAFRWVTIGTAAFLWAIVLALVVHVPTGILAPGEELADWDHTEDVFDWSGLAPALAAVAGYDGSQTIVVDSWIEAGQIGTGLAMGGSVPKLYVRHTPHHFAITGAADAVGPALYLVPGRKDALNAESAVQTAQGLDANAQDLGMVVLNRAGQPYAGVSVVALTLPPK